MNDEIRKRLIAIATGESTDPAVCRDTLREADALLTDDALLFQRAQSKFIRGHELPLPRRFQKDATAKSA